MTAADWIARLDLRPHPEGGHYREIHRSSVDIPAEALPEGFEGPRSLATIIYFLLAPGQRSRLHRLRSEEHWHFHHGQDLDLHILRPGDQDEVHRLGVGDGAKPVVRIPAGVWFGARASDRGHTLLSCTVAPGFDFADFELGDREALLAEFPEHQNLIRHLT